MGNKEPQSVALRSQPHRHRRTHRRGPRPTVGRRRPRRRHTDHLRNRVPHRRETTPSIQAGPPQDIIIPAHAPPTRLRAGGTAAPLRDRPQQRPCLPLIKGHRPRPGNSQEDAQARARRHRPGMGHPPHVPQDRSYPRGRPGDGIRRARQRSRHRHAPLHRALPDGSRRAKCPPGARTAKRGLNAARWRSGRFLWALRLDETL